MKETKTKSPKPRVWLEIDKTKLKTNFEKICNQTGGLKVIAVLKANAYGLGMVEIAHTLMNAGASIIGVAEVREALVIHKLGYPVQILGSLIPEEVEDVVRHKIIAPITDINIAKLISSYAQKNGIIAKCHILLDTGMGRLGIHSNYEEIIREIVALPNLSCQGIYSHFPVAFEDSSFSNSQVSKLVELVENLKKDGIIFKYCHIANSDGINNISNSLSAPFNMVRTGINLYGVHDLNGSRELSLDPVLTLKSRLVAIRKLSSGESIGYGRSYTLSESMKVGTVSIGYADGMPFTLSNQGDVIINGVKCPIIGQVSMDYITVSLENVSEVAVGDDVVCLGECGSQKITVEDWAVLKNSHPYDIICSIGSRVVRKYV